MTRTVALVAPHFAPSNFAGVHRARLWAQHLGEFGWKPIIVTTHWRHYEERLDWKLCDLVDPELEIIRTSALPTKPFRVVGDIGVRGLPWHLRALRRLFDDRRIDFLHITVPSFYSAILGDLLYRRRRVPFGIDYIDPWVHTWPGSERRFSKAWISAKLSQVLEPRAVRHASLITGVAEGYYAGVLARHPELADRAVTAAMPYGNSSRDFAIAAENDGGSPLFDSGDGRFHMVYAGAMLPRAFAVLDQLLVALVILRERRPDVYAKLRLHFIGTGTSSDDPEGYNILPRARAFGVDAVVSEHPARMPYAETLGTLTRASAILVLGSTEPHYTPSKVYQAVQARRPVFALLHEASTAVGVLAASRAGVVVTLTEERLPAPEALADRLAAFVDDPQYDADAVEWGAFEAFSARASARALAAAMDEALARFQNRAA